MSISPKKDRVRTSKQEFRCCPHHKRKSYKGKKFECDSCYSLWAEKCLSNRFGVLLRDIKYISYWKCPDCQAFDAQSSDDNASHSKMMHRKCKKSRRYKARYSDNDDNYSVDELSIDSTESEKTRDNSNKKITKKIKKRMQKKKAIQNRLKNVNPKYKLKYDQSMLEISDTATDEDFDSNTWYPERMPKTDKKLENLRRKKCKRNNSMYLKPVKKSKYRSWEKDNVITVICDVGENPGKYNYNQIFGWSATDVSEIVAKYLYKVRTEHPSKHISIPLRTPASIRTLFKRWEDTANKESDDKDYISKFEAAKTKLCAVAKKASSNVNNELCKFAEEYAVNKLERTEKQLKKLKKQCNVANEFKEAVSDVRGLIKELKDEKEETPKANVNYDENYDANNPFIDRELMKQTNAQFSPARNQIFIAQHKVAKDISSQSQKHSNSNMFDDDIHEMNVNNCCNFLTQLSNEPSGPFDEENDNVTQQVILCERKLFDDKKAPKLGLKFSALKRVTPKLSNKQILTQLSRTAELL